MPQFAQQAADELDLGGAKRHMAVVGGAVQAIKSIAAPRALPQTVWGLLVHEHIAQHVRHAGQHGVMHGQVEVIALAGLCATQERHQYSGQRQ